MSEYGDVRMVGYVQVEMCEWSGHNVRVNMDCVSDWFCASDWLCASKHGMCE